MLSVIEYIKKNGLDKTAEDFDLKVREYDDKKLYQLL